jgi:predicted dehydrogenase
MIKIAIIGFGNHVQKNILPALSRMKGIEADAVYVRDTKKYRELASEFSVTLKNIDQNLMGGVEWVYISTPISTHFDLASKYIELGKNVICEKPLTEKLDKSRALFALAKQHKVQLHEVCMYKFHKQFDHLQETVCKNLQSIKAFHAKFTIPHLPRIDIRYNKELGGGALLDVGYYPISLIISLFGQPEDIKFVKYSEPGYEVDLFGSAIIVYTDFSCIAEWGVGLPYTNEVSLTNESESFKYNRIFSKPESLETTVQVKKGFDLKEIVIGKDDQFVNLFEQIIQNNIGENPFIVEQIISSLNFVSNAEPK